MRQRRGKARVAGFSLVELMVALVVGLLLVSGIFGIQRDGSRGHRMQAELALLQERGRYAIDLLARDIRRVGYLGGNNSAATILNGLAAIDVPACAASDRDWARVVDQPLHGLDEDDEDPGCIPSGARSRGDLVQVRYAGEREITDFVDDRAYLRTSLFDGQIFEGSEQASVTLVGQPVTTRELIAHAYYIGPSERVCEDGSSIDALHWMTLDDAGEPSAEMLLPGVDQLQVRYGVDVNGDGSTDQYLDASEIDASPSRTWAQVSSVRLWILVATECDAAGYRDTRSYALGDTDFTPADGKRRHLFTTTVALRNRS